MTTFGVDDPQLIVGGEFEFATDQGGYFGRNLAIWKDPLWERLGGVDPDLRVNCFLTWDDPNDPAGPGLYVGGQFVTLNDVTFRRIARWDGTSWSPLATGLRGPPVVGASVFDMVIFDDGGGPNLYAGGFFVSTGDKQTPLANIARWDGQAWHDVGGGLTLDIVPGIGTDGVASMAVFDDGNGPALYVGGRFLEAGGKPIESLARWDGSEWSAVGAPLEAPDFHPDAEISVYSVIAFDDGTGPALWIGGYLGAPGVPSDGIARFRNGVWESAGELFGHNEGDENLPWIRDFAVHDHDGAPVLHVAGSFETAPPDPEDQTGGCVARWDAVERRWIDLDANSQVFGLTSQDDQTDQRLWAAGSFRYAGNDPNQRLASHNSEGWHRVGDDIPTRTEGVVSFDDGSGAAVYFTGGFETIGDLGWCHGIARYDEGGWSTVGSWSDIPGVDAAQYIHKPFVLDVGEGPSLYAFGQLTSAGEPVYRGVVRWDGAHWTTVGNELEETTGALFVYDEGMGPRLFAMPTSNPVIFRLQGNEWVVWASGDGYLINSAVMFDDGSGPALWVGGEFHEMEGISCLNIARYRPASGWEPVGSGADDAVLRIVTWDRGAGPELYIGGGFTKANGVTVNRVARWHGQTWESLGQGLAGGFGGQGRVGIEPWNDGSGPGLIAYGVFGAAGGKPAANIARWDGQEWHAMGTGIVGHPLGVVGHFFDGGPRLFVAGPLAFAGDYPSPGVASWVPCSTPCPADLDGNGSLDLFDFLAFVNLFNAEDPTADCNADQSLDLFDFLCFTNAFNEGC